MDIPFFNHNSLCGTTTVADVLARRNGHHNSSRFPRSIADLRFGLREGRVNEVKVI